MKSWKGNTLILAVAFVLGALRAYFDPTYGNIDWAYLFGGGIAGMFFIGLPILGVIALRRSIRNSADRVQRSCNKSTDRRDSNC
jgi:hypothetical protein